MTKLMKTGTISTTRCKATLEDVPGCIVFFALGDFNARVGSITTNREKIMGKHGLRDVINNGEKLVSVCENNLVIGGTAFTHQMEELGARLTTPMNKK